MRLVGLEFKMLTSPGVQFKTSEIVIIALTVLFSTASSINEGFPEDISSSPTIFETNVLPQDENGNLLSRYMATVGNGHIATTVYTDIIFMNGLYNGFKGESHRAIIPSRNNIRVSVDEKLEANISGHSYALDVEKGIFLERFTVKNYQVELRTFAHRFYHKIFVNQIAFKSINSGASDQLQLKLTSSPANQSIAVDIDFDIETGFESSWPSKYTCGKTKQVEDPRYQNSNPTICIIYSDIPNKIHAKDGAIFTFFAAYDRTLQGASGDFNAVATLVTNGKHEEIYLKHITAWQQVWNDGRIEVEGNLGLSKVIYGCLYYILTSLPVVSDTYSRVGQFYGISPGGLSYGSALTDFQGHSFWDTEIWVYPVVAYFYPFLAQEILNYRLFSAKAGMERAKETGYGGIRFGWESAATGAEVTPECCTETRDYQLHVTGDVAFAIRQYIAITRDFEWLKDTQPNGIINGCGLVRGIAEFWISKANFNKTTKKFDINAVMPPDADHHSVNNNGFTNVVAAYAIFFAKYVECLCTTMSMEPVPQEWVNIAKSLTFLYDSELNYHPEFEGYNPGDLIKQADVVLLGFPLMYQMDPETRKNDINIYEKATRQNGPAMTWAMHTVGILEFDEVDRAEAVFNRSYQSYMREPYKIWTEAQPPTLSAVNYMTGMGGFLQAVISGYGGYRLYPEKLVFNKPRLLPNSKSLKFVGLDFLENEFEVLIEPNTIKIILTGSSSKYFLTVENGNDSFTFVNGRSEVTLSNSDPSNPISFTITATPSNCPLPDDKINIPYEGNSGQDGTFMKRVHLLLSFFLVILQNIIL